MSQSGYKFRLYAEGRGGRRALGFIVGAGMTAAPHFDNADETQSREYKNRFDHWLDGNVFPKWFHGWDDPEFKDCFEFKRQDERLFGFKCHPKPKSNPRLQLVALAFYDDKEGADADKTMLRRVIRLKENLQTTQVLREFYREYGL